jgi:hypothetical protein
LTVAAFSSSGRHGEHLEQSASAVAAWKAAGAHELRRQAAELEALIERLAEEGTSKPPL